MKAAGKGFKRKRKEPKKKKTFINNYIIDAHIFSFKFQSTKFLVDVASKYFPLTRHKSYPAFLHADKENGSKAMKNSATSQWSIQRAIQQQPGSTHGQGCASPRALKLPPFPFFFLIIEIMGA